MSKKQEISARTPKRKAMSSPLQSTLQKAKVNMYDTLKKEVSEEGIGNHSKNYNINRGLLTYSQNKPQKSEHDVQGVIRQPISEGGRLVIVHAGTKEGFLPGDFAALKLRCSSSGRTRHSPAASRRRKKWRKNRNKEEVEEELAVAL